MILMKVTMNISNAPPTLLQVTCKAPTTTKRLKLVLNVYVLCLLIQSLKMHPVMPVVDLVVCMTCVLIDIEVFSQCNN